MKVNAIAALSPEGIIAADGVMPWYAPEDLKYFKSKTLNQNVLYGRKTFDSFHHSPLPRRRNFVLSSRLSPSSFSHPSLVFLSQLPSLSFLESSFHLSSLWVIGGASIYSQFWDSVSTFYISIIPSSFIDYSKIESSNHLLYFPRWDELQSRSDFSLSSFSSPSSISYLTYEKLFLP